MKSVSFYCCSDHDGDDDGFRCNISTATRDEERELTTWTNISASACPDFPGLFEAAKAPRVVNDVHKYFNAI